MKFEAKLGASRNQVIFLVGLLLVAAYFQFTGDDGRPPAGNQTPPAGGQRKTAAPAPAVSGSTPVTPAAAKSTPVRPNSSRRSTQEFKPVLRPRRIEDRVDPTTIDPTLRTDLLARLGGIQIQGGSRPLFEFSAPPPPKAPDPGKIIPAKPVTVAKPVAVAAAPPPPATSTTPVKPSAPPIPLKFYGFTAARAGAKRAFFLENEDVFVASEGELVKKRYKVVRVNLNSVVMEDTEYKQQQTLPLTEQTQ
jgi:hypothetical protein